MSKLDPELYTVAWIAPLEIEAQAVLHLLDHRHIGQFRMGQADDYIFIAGDICGHNVIIATLPVGQEYRTGSAGALASQVKKFFPNLRFGLLVGVAAGLPDLSRSPPRDIRLGDVLVALPEGESAGVLAYDLGKETGEGGFQPLRFEHVLANTEPVVRSAISRIKLSSLNDAEIFLPYYEGMKNREHMNGNFMDPGQDQDRLYECDEHGVEKLVERTRRPDSRRTRVWYGLIGSGQKLMKNARKRYELRDMYHVIGLEREAVGTINRFAAGVIRGVCDYGDENKNQEWQPYAAAMAAAYAKAILSEIPPRASPEERSETTPSPLSTVPFRRDPDFIYHERLLDHIHEKGSAPASRIALVGLGGVGKSQLAIEYSYRIRDRSPETWIFWIYASNAARFEQSFREIADQVKILGRKDPKANIFKLVYDWLQDKRKGKWVLIFDNIDDDRFLHEVPWISPAGSDTHHTLGQPLFTYLPLSLHGSIILTTRSKGVAPRMVEERDIIVVEPMDNIHAQALFTRKLGMEENQEDIRELVAALEFMPLAIVQAAAYIKLRAPRSSVKQYLEEFQKSDHKKISLLHYEGGHLRRDPEAENSIILTWQTSFDHIRQIRPTAADLLSLMSFFDRRGIDECLLRDRNASGNSPGKVEESWEDDDGLEDKDGWGDKIKNSLLEIDVNSSFEGDIVTLRNFSFISVNMDGASFAMLELVQLATQKWLEASGQLEQWKQQFIRNLSREFPTGEYQNWKRCELIFPHAQSAMAQRPDADDLLGEWALLLYNAAWFAWTKGIVIEVEEMAVKAMKARKKVLGPEHESTLSSINMVGLVLDRQKKYEEAKAMHQQALAARIKVLGIDHPDTLTSISNLGLVLCSQGKYEDAKTMHQQAQAAREQVLGIDHPDALTSISNLGLVLCSQGKYEEAKAMHQQALAARMKVLGVHHPDTLTSVSNLGSVLHSQGKYMEAEVLHLQALEAREKVLGVNHPDILASVSNLGSVLCSQGKYEEAEAMYRRALEGTERVLGHEHPSTLTSVSSLGSAVESQGWYEEAEALYRRALEGKKKVLGLNHPSTLSSAENLGSALERQGRHEEAEVIHRLVMVGNLGQKKDAEPLEMKAEGHSRKSGWDEMSQSSSPAPSVLSEISHASSYTQYTDGEIMTAAEQFVNMLVKDVVLEPLYDRGMKHPNIGPERFTNNFRRLLKIYGRKLLQEATTPLERLAAEFVLYESKYIATSVRRRYDPIYANSMRTPSSLAHILVLSGEEKRAQVESFLLRQAEAASGERKSRIPERNIVSEANESFEESPAEEVLKVSEHEAGPVDGAESEEEHNALPEPDQRRLTTLDGVEAFMLNGKAFQDFRETLHNFVEPRAPRTGIHSSSPTPSRGKNREPTNEHFDDGNREVEVSDNSGPANPWSVLDPQPPAQPGLLNRWRSSYQASKCVMRTFILNMIPGGEPPLAVEMQG